MASLTIQRFALAAAIMRLRSPPWRRREGEVPGEPWRTVTDRHSFSDGIFLFFFFLPPFVAKRPRPVTRGLEEIGKFRNALEGE